MSDNESLTAACQTHRCASCGASWAGWEEVHLLVTDTGLEFCSGVCRERFEDANDCDVTVVAESGMQASTALTKVGVAGQEKQ